MNTPVLVPKQTIKFFSNYPTLQCHLGLAGVFLFHFPFCLQKKVFLHVQSTSTSILYLLVLIWLFKVNADVSIVKAKGFSENISKNCWVQTYICPINCFLSRLSRFSSRFILCVFFKLNGNDDCYAFGMVFPFLSIFFGHCPKNSNDDAVIEKFKDLAGAELLRRGCIVEPEVGNNKKRLRESLEGWSKKLRQRTCFNWIQTSSGLIASSGAGVGRGNPHANIHNSWIKIRFE